MINKVRPRKQGGLYVVSRVVCAGCSATGNRSDKNEGWVRVDGTGQWLCWFCQQEPDEPLPICLSSFTIFQSGLTLRPGDFFQGGGR